MFAGNFETGMRIGLISDTHGWIHPSLYEHFAKCDEIWHAGDIGNIQTADSLSSFKPVRAVSGNIDDSVVRSVYPEMLKFTIGEMKIWMIHIGGTPRHYSPKIKNEIYFDPPDVFICGHSHIAKVMYDKSAGLLFINPGAAGYTGFHKYMTAIRFEISENKIHNLELIEMGLRGRTGP
jgi:putative phosphoesterase